MPKPYFLLYTLGAALTLTTTTTAHRMPVESGDADSAALPRPLGPSAPSPPTAPRTHLDRRGMPHASDRIGRGDQWPICRRHRRLHPQLRVLCVSGQGRSRIVLNSTIMSKRHGERAEASATPKMADSGKA